MKTLLKLFVVPFFFTAFVACNHQDEVELNNYKVDIATVQNPNNYSSFFFQLDNGNLMWTEESNFRDYHPKNGQRIIAYYTLLSNKKATGLYDYDVKLEDAYQILTKIFLK